MIPVWAALRLRYPRRGEDVLDLCNMRYDAFWRGDIQDHHFRADIDGIYYIFRVLSLILSAVEMRTARRPIVYTW